eukprot:scaffold873_cov111-Isochrysis_galbana.AAC.8
MDNGQRLGAILAGTSWDEIIPPAQHAPPEMQPYYGPYESPTFGVRAPMPAPSSARPIGYSIFFFRNARHANGG